MNSQDLHNLQEAYMGVYGLDEKFSDDTKRRATRHIKDTKKLLRSMGTEIDDKYNPEPEGYEPISDKKIKKKTQKEETDLYDIILSHLLDEGYAETQEQAEVIMVNMSEDWRESIVEEVLDEKIATPPSWYNMRRKLDPEKRRLRRSRDFYTYGGENQDPDERTISTSKGEGGITKNPKKLRKQKAMGEHG